MGFACTNGFGVKSRGCAAFAREKSQFIFTKCAVVNFCATLRLSSDPIFWWSPGRIVGFASMERAPFRGGFHVNANAVYQDFARPRASEMH
jgi:hypothetical protein